MLGSLLSGYLVDPFNHLNFQLIIFYHLTWEIWPIKIDFGRPNAEIGWKMANGQLLFLALIMIIASYILAPLQ